MSYDPTSRLARRELFSLLGAGALLARRAAAAESSLHFAALDHVGITVADAQKSTAFYARLFGNTVYKNNQTPRRYLKLGPCYMAIAPPAQGSQGYRVDHICPGVEPFQMADVEHYLEGRGVGFRKTDLGPFVTDPDGIQIQLWTEGSWSLAIRPAMPESFPMDGEPIFRPSGLEHILLDVTDPEKSAGFYEKLFGPVTQRNNNRTWFQAGKSRIGLLAVANGRRPGVNHFCVSAAAFDYDAAMKKLEQAGAKPVTAEVAGAPEFRDPDGILVQVMGPRAARGKQ
jgi:catechol 2,3-dioxygenase-like lactoylglutathione lyase family enzyme